MSVMRPQLVATAAALFAGAPGWPALAASGLPLLLVPEAAGGFGGDWGDAAAVLAAAGRAALAAPLAEAMLAARLLADAGGVSGLPADAGGVSGLPADAGGVSGLPADAGGAAPDGRVTLALQATGAMGDGGFTGAATAVPWGADAGCVALHGADLWLLPPGEVVATGENPAGEPRVDLVWRAAPALALAPAPPALPLHGSDLLALAGWARAAQASGALAAALDLAVAHVNGRVQFGKPLARQQAVQQQLAVLAAETAALTMAVAAAARALDIGGGAGAGFELAAAKLRMNLAIDRGVGIAHQVHGAIGFTADYPLHRLTRRLLAWRSEFGHDGHWAMVLGRRARDAGGAGLWAMLTERGDRA